MSIENINQTLYGKKIVVAKSYPRMQLSADCPVSDKFRDEFNLWLLAFFGFVCAAPRGVVYFFPGDNSVVMHPVDYAMLKAREAA